MIKQGASACNERMVGCCRFRVFLGTAGEKATLLRADFVPVRFWRGACACVAEPVACFADAGVGVGECESAVFAMVRADSGFTYWGSARHVPFHDCGDLA